MVNPRFQFTPLTANLSDWYAYTTVSTLVILGLLTLILVPVQLLLVAFAMRGFQQQWSVEVEVARDEAGRPRRGDDSSGGAVQPA